jgi:hypothetical protein
MKPELFNEYFGSGCSYACTTTQAKKELKIYKVVERTRPDFMTEDCTECKFSHTFATIVAPRKIRDTTYCGLYNDMRERGGVCPLLHIIRYENGSIKKE